MWGWFLRRMLVVSMNAQDMWILTMLGILTSIGPLKGVFTLSQLPVSWRYTLQSTIALLTTEAKYMALTDVVKESIWLQSLMDDLRIEQDFLWVHCDNMSVIYLAKNQVYHIRSKHIDVKYHFVRNILEDIEVKNIHTKDNPADMLTKVVPEIKFNQCKNLL